MSIAGHKVATGIGVAHPEQFWGPSGSSQVGLSTFNNVVNGLGSYVQYIQYYGYVYILWQESEPNEPLTITNVTNASPVEITTSASHGLSTGNIVSLSGIGSGNSNLNGPNKTITVTASNRFTVDGSTGDGAYSQGRVHVYDWTLWDEALNAVNGVNGKGGVPLKIGYTIRSKTFRLDTDPSPPWARVAPYEFTYTNDGRRKQLKIWDATCLQFWTTLIESAIDRYKSDSRVAFWIGAETDVGDARRYSGDSGFTDAGYHQGTLAELEAMRRGDSTGHVGTLANYYIGGWGSTYWNELLAKIEELTISVSSPDPIPYGKGSNDYNSSLSFHKGIFSWMRDRQSSLPIGSHNDDTLFFQWSPPWSEASTNDPYPETANRHLSFSPGKTRTTPDTAMYYCKNYRRDALFTMKWPLVAGDNFTLPELKQLFKEALERYTNDFPSTLDYYTGGAPTGPTVVTEYRLNCGNGPEITLADTRVFEQDVNGPSPSAFGITDNTVVMSVTTIENAPYEYHTLLPETNDYFEYSLPPVGSNETLADGVYDFIIYTMEPFHSAIDQRRFHVDAQGVRVETALDPYSIAGAQFVEVQRTYSNINVTGGQGVIRFTGDATAPDKKAIVHAIEIIQSAPITPAGKTTCRINVGASTSYTTADSRTFEADDESAWTGGAASSTTITATTTTIDQTPYQTRRLGPNSGYMERVFTGLENGSDWTVKIYYLEPWWSSVGARLFDLSIQAVTEQTAYDIYAIAGAQFVEVIDTHANVTVSDGTMTIRWTVGTIDKPILYAIELVKGSVPGGGGGPAFNVQRGEISVNGTLTQTDTSFTAVGATTSALELLPGAQHTAGGRTAGTGGYQVVQSSAHLALTNVSTLTATRLGSTDETRLFWELADYIGSPGGANEWIIRHRSVASMANGVSSVDVALSGVSDITKVVPFISIAAAADSQSFHHGACTAEVLTGTNEVRITRVGTYLACDVALVAVEFTGASWTVQQNISHTFVATGVDETETVTDVVDWSDCIIYPTHRSGSSLARELGITARPGSNTTSIRFRVEAGLIDSQVAIAHIIKNTGMTVEHLDSITGGLTDLPAADGVNPQSENYTITAVAALAETILIPQATSRDTGANNPAAMWIGRLTTTTNVEMWRGSIDGINGDLVLQVAQLPQDAATDTTAPTVPQNLTFSQISATSMQVNCDPVTDEESGVDYYEWERDSVIDSTTTEIPQKDFTGLAEYTEYSIRVRAYDNAGNVSAWSEANTGRTADATAPTVPSGNSATVLGANELDIQSSGSTDTMSGVNRYVLRETGGLFDNFEISAFPHELGALSPNTTYTMTLSGVDNAGNESAPSASFQATTYPIGWPSWYGYRSGFDYFGGGFA